MKAFSIRNELWIASCVILLSMLLLPVMIYLVGSRLFTAYPSGLAGFYTSNLQGILHFQVTSWVLLLAPACGVLLIRTVMRVTTRA